MGCRTETKLKKAARNAADTWKNDPSIRKYNLHTDDKAFKRLAETVIDKPYLAGAGHTVEDYNQINLAAKKFGKDLRNSGTLTWPVIKHLYVGKVSAQKNPITAKFYETIRTADEFRAKQTQKMNQNYNNMISELKFALMEFDGFEIRAEKIRSSSYQISDFMNPKNIYYKRMANKNFENLTEKEQKYKEAVVNNLSTEKTWGILEKFLDNEGSAFSDLFSTIENGNVLHLKSKYKIIDPQTNQMRVDPSKLSYINRINNAANSWKNIQEYSKTHIIQSVNSLAETVNLKFGKNSKVTEKIVKEYKGIAKSLKDFDGSYVPHYVLDLLSHVNNVADDMRVLSDKGTQNKLDNVLNTYFKEASQINTSLFDRLKKRSGKTSIRFSRNPLQYDEKYISHVVRFNHSTFVDKAYTQGLQDLTKVIFKNPDSKEANAAGVYKDILNDFYNVSTQKNRLESSPFLGGNGNLVRFMTSLQFIAKLGISPRGAIRNKSQRLFDFFEFGGRMINDSRRAYEADKVLETAMKNQLDARGLQFVDTGTATRGALNSVDLMATNVGEINGIGHFSDVDMSWMKKKALGLVKGTSELAQASAIFTQSVENSNRASTFKIAFYKRYKQLQLTDKYAGGKNTYSMHREAGNFAARMTSMLHYDYAPFAKAKWLRSGPGAFLNQFQHFTFSTVALTKKLGDDYVRSIRAGEGIKGKLKQATTSSEGQKLAGYAAIYAIAEAISVGFDINFTSLVNNPIIEKVKGVAEMFSDDDEVKSDAFYGKGLVGALGFVPVSDVVEIINLGRAAGYYNMLIDDESTAAWLLGLRKYDRLNNTEFAQELFGMTNIALERTINRTFPAFSHSNPAWSMLRSEFGLYPGTTQFGVETRKTRKEFLKSLGINKKSKFKLPHIKDKVTGSLDKDSKRRAIESLSLL